jgi:hypothetical protein
MKNLFYFFLIMSSLGTKAQQTYSISGQVTDEKGITLPGATVFIANTTYINASDNEGKFSFDKIRPGTYEVVAKMIGFEPDIQSVTISDRSITITAKLKEAITGLKTVTINSPHDPNRAKYMEWFTRNFIGETLNATRCKILNPDVLKFHFDQKTGILNASADEFVIIENMALGYTIKYLINKFEYNINNDQCTYGGHPYFEEMKGTEQEQKNWEDKRQTAYLLSRAHFYKAMRDSTAETEGFSIYTFPPANIILHNLYKLYDLDLVAINTLFDPKLMDKDTSAFKIYFIYFKKKEVAILQETPAHSFLTEGYWAMMRMADLTPVNYFVDPSPWSGLLPAPKNYWHFGPIRRINKSGKEYK